MFENVNFSKKMNDTPLNEWLKDVKADCRKGVLVQITRSVGQQLSKPEIRTALNQLSSRCFVRLEKYEYKESSHRKSIKRRNDAIDSPTGNFKPKLSKRTENSNSQYNVCDYELNECKLPAKKEKSPQKNYSKSNGGSLASLSGKLDRNHEQKNEKELCLVLDGCIPQKVEIPDDIRQKWLNLGLKTKLKCSRPSVLSKNPRKMSAKKEGTKKTIDTSMSFASQENQVKQQNIDVKANNHSQLGTIMRSEFNIDKMPSKTVVETQTLSVRDCSVEDESILNICQNPVLKENMENNSDYFEVSNKLTVNDSIKQSKSPIEILTDDSVSVGSSQTKENGNKAYMTEVGAKNTIGTIKVRDPAFLGIGISGLPGNALEKTNKSEMKPDNVISNSYKVHITVENEKGKENLNLPNSKNQGQQPEIFLDSPTVPPVINDINDNFRSESSSNDYNKAAPHNTIVIHIGNVINKIVSDSISENSSEPTSKNIENPLASNHNFIQSLNQFKVGEAKNLEVGNEIVNCSNPKEIMGCRSSGNNPEKLPAAILTKSSRDCVSFHQHPDNIEMAVIPSKDIETFRSSVNTTSSTCTLSKSNSSMNRKDALFLDHNYNLPTAQNSTPNIPTSSYCRTILTSASKNLPDDCSDEAVQMASIQTKQLKVYRPSVKTILPAVGMSNSTLMSTDLNHIPKEMPTSQISTPDESISTSTPIDLSSSIPAKSTFSSVSFYQLPDNIQMATIQENEVIASRPQVNSTLLSSRQGMSNSTPSSTEALLRNKDQLGNTREKSKSQISAPNRIILTSEHIKDNTLSSNIPAMPKSSSVGLYQCPDNIEMAPIQANKVIVSRPQANSILRSCRQGMSSSTSSSTEALLRNKDQFGNTREITISQISAQANKGIVSRPKANSILPSSRQVMSSSSLSSTEALLRNKDQFSNTREMPILEISAPDRIILTSDHNNLSSSIPAKSNLGSHQHPDNFEVAPIQANDMIVSRPQANSISPSSRQVISSSTLSSTEELLRNQDQLSNTREMPILEISAPDRIILTSDHNNLSSSIPAKSNLGSHQHPDNFEVAPIQANKVIVSRSIQANKVIVSRPIQENKGIVSRPIQANKVIVSRPIQENKGIVSRPIQANKVIVSRPQANSILHSSRQVMSSSTLSSIEALLGNKDQFGNTREMPISQISAPIQANEVVVSRPKANSILPSSRQVMSSSTLSSIEALLGNKDQFGNTREMPISQISAPIQANEVVVSRPKANSILPSSRQVMSSSTLSSIEALLGNKDQFGNTREMPILEISAPDRTILTSDPDHLFSSIPAKSSINCTSSHQLSGSNEGEMAIVKNYQDHSTTMVIENGPPAQSPATIISNESDCGSMKEIMNSFDNLDLAKLKQISEQLYIAMGYHDKMHDMVLRLHSLEGDYSLEIDKVIREFKNAMKLRSFQIVPLFNTIFKKYCSSKLEFFMVSFVKLLENIIVLDVFGLFEKCHKNVEYVMLTILEAGSFSDSSILSVLRLPHDLFNIAVGIVAKLMRSAICSFYNLHGVSNKYYNYIQRFDLIGFINVAMVDQFLTNQGDLLLNNQHHPLLGRKTELIAPLPLKSQLPKKKITNSLKMTGTLKPLNFPNQEGAPSIGDLSQSNNESDYSVKVKKPVLEKKERYKKVQPNNRTVSSKKDKTPSKNIDSKLQSQSNNESVHSAKVKKPFVKKKERNKKLQSNNQTNQSKSENQTISFQLEQQVAVEEIEPLPKTIGTLPSSTNSSDHGSKRKRVSHGTVIASEVENLQKKENLFNNERIASCDKKKQSMDEGVDTSDFPFPIIIDVMSLHSADNSEMNSFPDMSPDRDNFTSSVENQDRNTNSGGLPPSSATTNCNRMEAVDSCKQDNQTNIIQISDDDDEDVGITMAEKNLCVVEDKVKKNSPSSSQSRIQSSQSTPNKSVNMAEKNLRVVGDKVKKNSPSQSRIQSPSQSTPNKSVNMAEKNLRVVEDKVKKNSPSSSQSRIQSSQSTPNKSVNMAEKNLRVVRDKVKKNSPSSSQSRIQSSSQCRVQSSSQSTPNESVNMKLSGNNRTRLALADNKAGSNQETPQMICFRQNCDQPAVVQCSRCKKARYCVEYCQTMDWYAVHQYVCSVPIAPPKS